MCERFFPETHRPRRPREQKNFWPTFNKSFPVPFFVSMKSSSSIKKQIVDQTSLETVLNIPNRTSLKSVKWEIRLTQKLK